MPADVQLLPLVLDEVADDCHRDDQVGRLMLLVVLLQMNSMEMSTTHLEAHEDLDVQDVEEEEMRWSIVMPSIPVRMRLLVMMDGHCSFLGRLMVRRRAVLCYHVKFGGVFCSFSSRMTLMRGKVVFLYLDVVLVSMIMVN